MAASPSLHAAATKYSRRWPVPRTPGAPAITITLATIYWERCLAVRPALRRVPANQSALLWLALSWPCGCLLGWTCFR
jgi:hypothetical protein